MPLYEYQCDACQRRFEVIEKFSDPPAETCASCGKGPVRRLVSSPAIQFKGSGWYITDYARKGKSDGGSDSKAASDSGSGKSETKAETKADTKDAAPAAKTDTKSETKPST